MRSFLNKYGYHLIAAAVVLTGIALFLNTRKPAEPALLWGNPDLAFFVDEETGAESVMTADQIPPQPNKDGKETLVIAAKYKADNEKEAKTYYWIKYPTEIRDKVQALPKDDMNRNTLLEASILVRSPEPGSRWVSGNSSDAEKIVIVPPGPEGHQRRPVYPDKL